MFYSIRKLVVYCWDFVFNHEVSPLRNIPDVAMRHYVLQALGLMWAVAFAVAAGSYTFLAVRRYVLSPKQVASNSARRFAAIQYKNNQCDLMLMRSVA